MTAATPANGRGIGLHHPRLLGMLRTANENNRARIALATLALIRMKTDASPPLFELPPGTMASKALSKQRDSKSWQREFIGRIPIGPDGEYRKDFVAPIIANVIEGDGSQLRKLLWPRDYEDDAPDASDDEQGADSEAESPSLLVGLSQALGSLVETTTRVVDLAGDLKHAMEAQSSSMNIVEKGIARLSALEERLSARMAEVERGVTEIHSAAIAFNAASEKFDKLIGILEDDKRRQLADLTKNMADNTGRKRSVLNQLDSVTTKENELMSKLNELLGGDNR